MLIVVVALFGSLQLGINMGYNKGLEDAGGTSGTKVVYQPTPCPECPKMDYIDRIIFKDAPCDCSKCPQLSSNTTGVK